MAENPNNIPQEQIDRWKEITKDSHDNILGLCMFCQHPIFLSEIQQGPINFRFIPQTLILQMDDKAIQETLGGFFCCGKCIAEPAKVEVMKQITIVKLDLNQLNAKFAEHLRQYEIKKAYKENLEKELEKENQEKAEEEDEKESVQKAPQQKKKDKGKATI